MSSRPVFKDVIAYASKLLEDGEKKIMFELINAYAEQESEEEQNEKKPTKRLKKRSTTKWTQTTLMFWL